MCLNNQTGQPTQGMTPTNNTRGTPFTGGANIKRTGLPSQSLQSATRPVAQEGAPSISIPPQGQSATQASQGAPTLAVPQAQPVAQPIVATPPTGPEVTSTMTPNSPFGSTTTTYHNSGGNGVASALSGQSDTAQQAPGGNRDANLDTALNFVTGELEGSAPTREHNGRISRWGVGSDADEPTPSNQQQAKQFIVQKYINQYPQRAAYLAKLNTPKDQAAYIQGLLLNPAPIDGFATNYQGQVGGDAWREALLTHQAQFLHSIHGPHAGWDNRLAAVRGWSPVNT